MGLWDKLKGELVDVIEWLDGSNEVMVYRFQRYANEIKYGAKLIVREGQAAAFVNEGRLADVFKPGTYTLETKNLPLLSTLLGWKHGFESPFKAEVYFCATRRFTDLKWGTKNPIMLRDAEFGPVRIRAFGTYCLRIQDPAAFLREIVGTDGRFQVDEISDQLRNLIVTRFTDRLGESRIPVLDMAGNLNELGEFIEKQIKGEFEGLGLELSKLLVENVSLPEAVEKVLDQRTSMGVIGNLQAYTQFQTAQAIPDAARNPGGLAAAGMSLGVGVGMANTFSQGLAGGGLAGAVPPPLPGQQALQFFVALNNQQAGPFDRNMLLQQARSGQLTRQTLVWREGMAAWQQAGEVAELAGIFGQVPPPLPPQPPQAR